MPRTIRTLILLLAALFPAALPVVRAQGASDQALLAEERAECDRLVRRGEARTALRRIGELLAERPDDAEALLVRARARLELVDYEAVLADARAARAQAPAGVPGTPVRAAALRLEAQVLVELGRGVEALALLDANARDLALALDARDAWAEASAAFAAGKRERALGSLAVGADTGNDQSWDALLARGSCQRRLGKLEAASKTYITALDALKDAGGDEPDLLVALGEVYFEADREVEEGARRSAAKLYREALRLHPTHEGALLGLYALHRYNWQRQRESAAEILDKALTPRPKSVRTLVAAASADLDDGQLKSARERLAVLESLAPQRRDVRTLRATLFWIEHDTAQCERILKELADADPADAMPEREVGRHLLELYRFAEGLPFVKRASERDPSDYEALTQLGRALANTGDEDGARKALDAAQKAAAGRQDAWRDNMRLVLKRLSEKHTTETRGDLTFSWDPDGGEVLSTYLIPFYADARAELAKRYGFTPGPTRIEVFRAHRDFSVRSTGFEGFPALGVCFGPVVTAVSPLWEMRGTQSWARTSFHEFTHVVHLGLSHNRCPRWITEGLATWEEVNRNPAWTRNMRRELVDSIANGQVIPVRELNRAFRGPRILFGYYQGGLMCQMLIERHGFAPIVKFLEAFDRGLDLDQALKEVYATTPEALDREFLAFVTKQTADLRIEPRWDAARVARIQLGLGAKAPALAEARAKWIDGWCTVAWSAWQRGKKLDAEEALRRLKDVSPEPARASMLRGFIALAGEDKEAAARFMDAAIQNGGDDYRARVALAQFRVDAGDVPGAEQHLLAALKAFPGYDDKDLSAELRLAELYDGEDRGDDAMAMREKWIAWNAGDVTIRRQVAEWHVENGREARACELYAEVNEVDPFQRDVHRAWADALRNTGRFEEALREYGSTLAVPETLDVGGKKALENSERAELQALQAECLLELGRREEALARAKEALATDADSPAAKSVLQKLQ
jgi:tetratricopeptide (TPR) repeat protein